MKKLILAMGMMCAMAANAATLTQGQSIPAFELQDQNEQLQQVTAETRTLLFSRDMKGGEIIQESLESMGDKIPADLVYVADISGMPGLIAKFVAIPQLQKLPFAIALDREGQATAALPSQEDKAAVIKLDGLKMVDIQYYESADSLTKALQP
ncbi:hypothetical protein L2750_14410 [Shewanella submarina]|uniref:Periplasmic protein n=1 Tax=Shewanella submarina TaxID=2016376 RepID=A0ABV7GC88_9GAMM|nr:hypothetical protein [Shewanella submarina]MCL1038323.1 hypothetical protein [Shewanella submarina]